MYSLVTVEDTVRIPPKLFSENLEKSVVEVLRTQYEGKLDKDIGVVISVSNPRNLSDGKVIPGDGAAFHTVTFDALTFKPELHEVIRGKVSEITEFGAFVRFGPIDGLVHVSQVTDDFMSFNDKTAALAGKDSKKVLKKDDIVKARVIAVSFKNTVADSKINLTMRQPGLGKAEWRGKKASADKPTKKKKADKE